ncbi:HEAT repeat domain-containing protein [Streptomyces sp. NPDC004065]|uniref:HEAT repeat domain-containing protein n=1 Tax=Streptomyces sp. NPDC004065 TaxID=3364689 RepID=UPI003851006C
MAMVMALSAENASVRLQAALAIGSDPRPAVLEALVERCAVEPDFFVRDMLSWALTRFAAESTLPLLRRELHSEHPQARSQALHTLSKIGDSSAWDRTAHRLLHDAHDEVARTAWRVAVALVPEDGKEDLADALVTQLGRGDSTVRRSLSRALVGLGDAAGPALRRAAAHSDPEVALHARATAMLRNHPEAGFDAAVEEAKRILALGPEGSAAAATAAAGAARPIGPAEPAGTPGESAPC